MLKFFVFVFMVLGMTSSFAMALESRWASADYVQARLLSGAGGVGEEMRLPAALEIRLGEGWHSYWRMPGDGGLAPVFSWEGSENVETIDFAWPAPQRFEMVGLYSFGYEDHVILPLKITLSQPGEATELKLQAQIMVCQEICVPQSLDLALTIPPGAATPTQAMKLIETAEGSLPHEGDLPNLRIENFVAGPDAIVVTTFSQNGYEQADLFIEAGDLYITAPPEITLDKDDPRKAMLRVAAPEGAGSLADYVAGRDVTLTLVNGREAVEKTLSF